MKATQGLDQSEGALTVKEWLFSVVIPAYNAEQYVREALDSVARQTFTEYEIVVVDDGSSDGTPKQVACWAVDHPRIELRVIQQEHGGIGRARNAGVRGATGTYVAFLDVDDLWMERKLETVALYCQQPKAVELFCHDEWLEENGRRRRLRYGPYATYRQLLFKGNCLSTSATVVRRTKLLEVGGFSDNPRFNGVEDYELWLRLARTGCCIEYIHEPLGIYRVHGRGITSRIEEHCAHYLNVLEAHFESWQPQTAYCRCLMRRRRAAVLRGAGRASLKVGRHREARLWFMKSLLQDPFSWKAWALSTLNLLRISV
ncbi:MAG: glycosyltransferase [Nitrospira sp.]|nr:glycosyltransferase [Nitrospira sp.]